MNCETAIELLPWFLNGTLDVQERNQLQVHLKDCEACRLALAETQQAWATFDQHLPTDVLVALAYAEERPAGMDRAEAERHLAACARCSAELELALTSRRLETEDDVLLFKPRQTVIAESRVSRPSGRGWQLSAIAAGLAGVIFFSAWMNGGQQIRTLRSQLAARSGAAASGVPQVIATEDRVPLEPTAVKNRGPEDAVSLPAGRGSSLELLGDSGIEPAERASITSYRVEVWRAGGEKLGETPVRYLENGSYAVTVGGLLPDAYELRVFGRSAGGEKPYETYAFKVGA